MTEVQQDNDSKSRQIHLGDTDGQSCSSRSSKSNPAMETLGKNGEREDLAIAKEEDRAVYQIRRAVAAFLFLCTIGVAWIVYTNTKNQEQNLFRTDFDDFALKVLDSFGDTLHHTVAAMDIYAVESTSYANAMNMTWPFVVLPDSGTRLSKVLSVAKAALISVIPVVTNANREEWDIFSVERGPEWVEDNLRIQRDDPGFTGTQLEEFSISPLYSFEEIPDNLTRYYPMWQAYPTASRIAHAYNIDFQTKQGISFELIEHGVAQISNVINDPFLDPGASGFLSDFVGGDYDVSEPFSDCYYPVFQDAASSLSTKGAEKDAQTAPMVAFLALTFRWRNQLLNTLPTGIEGLVLVISTECNSTFTYEINGPDVAFLGYGDHHDTNYDDMVLESSLLEIPSFSSSSSSSFLPISQDICAYTFRIYPSAHFQELYMSSDPLIYTAVAVGIFLLTSVVFWIYDSLVEHRQRTVLSTAVKSSAIVSALFPTNVRDRLYDFDGTSPRHTDDPNHSEKRSSLSTGRATNIEKDATSASVGNDRSRPIADLFPEATVMFADIAEFTFWSSTREPSQVFFLLESVYGLFDKLAEKRHVFKVETIGDSYLAVAGLPDARSDHAVAMAKFAADCCTQMGTLMLELCKTLGPGTENLSLRCGLNSGPVTAGVLRGQKSRFQLFGDTVNIASRMESTGEKNRIQASESTADELIKHNKAHWLQSRQDKVNVKGKGAMATYWVVPHKRVESTDCTLDNISLENEDHHAL